MSEKREMKMKSLKIDKSNNFEDFDDEFCHVTLSLSLRNDNTLTADYNFFMLFNQQILLEEKWKDNFVIDDIILPFNLKDELHQSLVADTPLTFLLRAHSGKPTKDSDPLVNIDNRAGGNVDLFPLVLGEKNIKINVPLVFIDTGLRSGFVIEVYARSIGESKTHKIPLMLTMISAHCLTNAKEGTTYISAIGLDGIHDPTAVNFGMSFSNSSASRIVWSAISSAGHAANSAYNVPKEDSFIQNGLSIGTSDICESVNWNAMRRILVDPLLLHERFAKPFFLDIAGVPKSGKMEVRGRYIAIVDAGVLLQPGQSGVTICAKLFLYSSENLPENFVTILDLPPNSARGSTRENDITTDEKGHDAYVVLRINLMEPLVPKSKLTSLFDLMGFLPPIGVHMTDDVLQLLKPSEEPPLDKRRIGREGGALLVHKEFSNLSQKSTLQLNKNIKRTAANRLLMRVRSMLKRFPPGDCSQIDYQDIITSQHSITRRAVLSSFAPPTKSPKLRLTAGLAAARSRHAGDTRISIRHIETNLKACPSHPRVLLSKVLRCLEDRDDGKALNYLQEALNVHSRNRYLLWTFGGIQFNKGLEAVGKAAAALKIAVKGDTSDGTTCAIGFAALHTLYHFHGNDYGAFVASKKMRKAFELPTEWSKCLRRWIDSSGEEETFWTPAALDSQNPLLISAAFFLCLRCFEFSERVLRCVEDGCYTRGARLNIEYQPQPEIYYLRAASLILRHNLDEALEVAEQGVKRFGPSAILSQIRATCLAFCRRWDSVCESALLETDYAGAEPSPALLLRAALGSIKSDLENSLQRVARAHKIAPSAHTALTIGRIYSKMGEEKLAERWAAAAVNFEPLLSDGWAFLAILAMNKSDINKAKALFRTARQAGPLSQDMVAELDRFMKVLNVDDISNVMVKDLCLCDYY